MKRLRALRPVSVDSMPQLGESSNPYQFPSRKSGGVTPVVLVITFLSTVAGLACIAALVPSGRSTIPAGVCALSSAVAVTVAIVVAMLTTSKLNRSARRSTVARFLLGLDAAILAGCVLVGTIAISSCIPNGFTWHFVPIYLTLSVLGLAAAFIAALGILVSVGAVRSVRLVLILRSLWSTCCIFSLTDLTLAGWLATLLTGGAVLFVGVPLAMWLYQGVRPVGWPNTVLALPVIAVGLVWFVSLSAVARALGIEMIRDR